MIFKEKYLKYKEKYLKNKLGGSKTFTIYTTGAGDWDSQEIYNNWENFLCQHVCSMIPSRFTNIEIHHYDPSLNLKKVTDDSCIDSRISKTFFKKEIIELENFKEISKSSSYLILDFAHIFKYHKISDPITPSGSTLVSINPNSDNLSKKNIEQINLNIVYIGYLGLNYNLESTILAKTKWLKINDHNTIDTFITKLLDTNRFQDLDEFTSPDIYDTSTIISQKFVEIIRKKIAPELHRVYGDYTIYDKYLGLDVFYKPESIYLKKIYNYTIHYIMNTSHIYDDIILTITDIIKKEIMTRENIINYNKYYKN